MIPRSQLAEGQAGKEGLEGSKRSWSSLAQIEHAKLVATMKIWTERGLKGKQNSVKSNPHLPTSNQKMLTYLS